MTETSSSSSNKVYEKDGFVIQRKYINQILANNVGGKKYFLQIMLVLKRSDPTKVFYYDIDPRYAPSYYEVIKEPMNFAIIRKNIQDDKYTTLDSFFKDVFLMFKNAKIYNDKDTLYYKFADEMEKYSIFLKNLIREGVQKKISSQKPTSPSHTPSSKEENEYQKIERKIQELDAISKNTPFEFPLHKYTKRMKVVTTIVPKVTTRSSKEAAKHKEKKEALKEDLADDKLYNDIEWAVMLNKTRSTKTHKCGKDCGCKDKNVHECVCIQFGLNCKSGCLCYLACDNNTNNFRNKNTFDFNHDAKTPSKVLNIDLIRLVGIDELGRSTFTKILMERIKQTEIVNLYEDREELKVHILALLEYCILEINTKITDYYKAHKISKNINMGISAQASMSNLSTSNVTSGKNDVKNIPGLNSVGNKGNISKTSLNGGVSEIDIVESLRYSNINFKDHLFEYNMAQSKLNFSEELKEFVLQRSKDGKFNTFVEQFYKGIKSIERLNHAIYQIHLYDKGLSPVNLTNSFKRGEVVILLGGEVLSPFHFVERQNTIAALQKYLQFIAHPFYSFSVERHWDDPTGYDALFCTIPTVNKLNEIASTGNDSKVILQLLNHSCDPNLTITSFLINRQYYPVISAIKDIEPGTELTLDYREIVGFFGGSRKRVCLCSSLSCLSLLSDYINYSVKNMENLFKSNSTSEIHIILSNAAVLYKSIGQLREQNNVKVKVSKSSANDNIDDKIVYKEFLNNLGIKDCILDLAPEWLQMFVYNILKSTEDLTSDELHKEYTFINNNKHLFPRSSCRQAHKMNKDEMMASKIFKLSMLVDFVKHFITRKVHMNDKPPLMILTDKEVVNKLFLAEDSLVNEARKLVKSVLSKHTNTNQEGLIKLKIDMTIDQFRSYITLLKTVHRVFSTKPASFTGNGQEEAKNVLTKAVSKVKEFIIEHKEDCFESACKKVLNLKLLLQILFLWFNTSNFFYLNKYSSIMQRNLEVEEIIAKTDLAEIEKNDENAKVEFNKHCNTDRKYSPYYPWLCCLYWEFPFIKKSNTSLNQQKVFSYVLPGIENCKGIKELKMVGELKELRLNSFYQNNSFDYKYKTKSIYGTPWLDYFISGDMEKYKDIIEKLSNLFNFDNRSDINSVGEAKDKKESK